MNEVYQATVMLETLANYRIIRGNGHHIRQEAARLVANLLKERWIDPELGDRAVGKLSSALAIGVSKQGQAS
jgi:hypothetical protein